MGNNMEWWNKLEKPPVEALQTITGGRLSGKTDINPQWRYKALTELFGPCGIGWKYDIESLWLENGANEEIFAFAQINLHVAYNVEGKIVWSLPIPGVGGSMLVKKEKEGLYNNDEAFKMAVTDAISVAFKLLGGAAAVYMGRWDGNKYSDWKGSEVVSSEPEIDPMTGLEAPTYPNVKLPSPGTKGINDAKAIIGLAQTMGWSEDQFITWYSGILPTRDFAEMNQAQAALLLKRIKDLSTGR